MNKKRILMCAESHTINSGFGRYTEEILKRLYQNPSYEIAEFASYRHDGGKKDRPWKIYPNCVSETHEDYKIYKSNEINQFGQWRFEKVVMHFRPDIVFDIRDYWMFSYQELSPTRPYFHWIVAPTIDSIPQKPEWLMTYKNADIVLTHTDWAASYLKSVNQNINVVGCISDSVNPDEFKPISWTKTYHKAKHGIPSDSFVIGSVMRNQKRKLIAELFASLKQIIEQTQNNKIFLYLHTSYPEAQGWNIPELLQEYGVYNNVLFTYYSPTKQKFYVSPFKGVRIICPDDSNSVAFFPNVINGVNNDHLKEIYNLFDIYVQYAICEGLGIPQLEAASCGIPIFAINYSGMEELTTKLDGVKLDHILIKELETSADRAYPINNHLVEKVIEWINLPPKTQKENSRKTRDLLVKNYSWDKTAENIMKVFDTLEPKNIWHKPMRTNTTVNVPDNLSNRDFIYYIVDNVLMEPKLKYTFYIQNLIKSLDDSLMINNAANAASKFDRPSAVKFLEVYLNNKIYCEKIRNGEINLSEFSFLNE